ncbi:hypothetical protein AAFF_G00070990 [Aldrovandia affinis]|uniref:Uncharacterized protein n=1 Tax=Aldrovandia affinis TaxID=143900 RepID=A0AAD7WDS8_9TELE|nr:hypothetical protein AAFF_G00070990 [Aldrovandia affinis]
MDREEQREKWKKTYTFIHCLLFYLTLCTALGQVGGRSNQANTCQGDEFKSKKGHCCNKCPPGFRLQAECPAFPFRSNCTTCPLGYFQDQTNNYENCWRCKKCKPDKFEKVFQNCTNIKNTECGCEDGYEKTAINDYTLECKKVSKNSEHYLSFVVAMAYSAAVTAVVIGFIIYKIHRRCQSKSTGLPTSSPTENATEPFIISHATRVESSGQESDFQVSPSVLVRREPVRLPDCVPKEFELYEFIYFVLDLVPADRFKELVRRLGISERSIERAEIDHRSFKDVQYEMLKVWGESGGRGAGGTLSRRLFLELVDRLREMGLRVCVEAIEEKYGIQ